MLHALLIAINDYPIERHRLKGCVADRNAVHDFLAAHCAQKKIPYQPLLLTDQTATRQGIIGGFRHFDAAKNGDTCVLYFSGHGAQTNCPPEFDEPDGLAETLVCYDSRLPNGLDLIDKELSFLIYKANKNKDIHFLAIMDCCHAGGNTREVGAVARMAEPAFTPISAMQYLGMNEGGYATITRDGKQYYEPLRGRHIQLAAAKANQTAKETAIDNATRGVFSSALIATLRRIGTNISYAQLTAQLQINLKSVVTEQTPEVSVTGYDNANVPFLGGAFAVSTSFLLKMKTANSGEANVGAVNGLRVGGKLIDAKSKIVFDVTNIAPSTCTVSTQNNLKIATKIGDVIDVQVLDYGRKPVLVAFTADSDAKGKAALEAECAREPTVYFALTDNLCATQYHIACTAKGEYILYLPNNPQPVFKRVSGDFGAAQAMHFVEKVAAVCKHRQLTELQNPITTIKETEYKVEVFRVDAVAVKAKGVDVNTVLDGNLWSENFEGEAVADIKNPIVCKYDNLNNALVNPGIRIKITNTSNRNLFVGAVVATSNFGLSNAFLPVTEVTKGNSVWVRELYKPDVNTVIEYKTMILSLPYASDGLDASLLVYPDDITEIDNNYKIIISTEAFTTDDYEQDGLELEAKAVDTTKEVAVGRAALKKAVVAQPDWTTVDVRLKVVRPRASETIVAKQSTKLTNMSLAAHPALQGKATLTSAPTASRDAGAASAPDFSSKGITPFAFTDGLGGMAGLSVLELHDVADPSAVTKKQPLKVVLDTKLQPNEAVLPFGYDPETGWYYPLGKTSRDGKTIRIEQLPDPLAATTRSTFGAFQVFFQRVVLDSKAYPLLREAEIIVDTTVEGGLRTNYISSDTDYLRKRVAEAKNIVLFIHGIIGDTEIMTQSIVRAQKNGTAIGSHYDLVLTFDYESLNTTINETAADLRKRLIAIGLGSHHGKKLHFVAHSMGGLVSRWMTEKMYFHDVITHLFQLGTPNAGSEWSNVQDMATAYLPKAINAIGSFIGVPPFLTAPLAWASGKVLDSANNTLEQMHPKKSPLLGFLNDGTDPEIPMTIIAGNTQLLEQEKSLFKRLFNQYAILDATLFSKPNDMAATVESIFGVKDRADRKFKPVTHVIPCDHISYFLNPNGLNALADAVFEVNE